MAVCLQFGLVVPGAVVETGRFRHGRREEYDAGCLDSEVVIILSLSLLCYFPSLKLFGSVDLGSRELEKLLREFGVRFRIFFFFFFFFFFF